MVSTSMRFVGEFVGEFVSCLGFVVWFMVSFSGFAKLPAYEHSGSVVECLTQDRGAECSSLTGINALWSLSKTHLS